tara:strand:+ start:60 stop:410 length:351 start_codon:yes stop_codon:yes gene_type:complete
MTESKKSSIYRNILIKHCNEYGDDISIETININASIFTAIGCIPTDFLNGAGQKGNEAMLKYMNEHKKEFTNNLSPIWLHMYIANIDAILMHCAKERDDAISKLDDCISFYGGLCE